MSAVFRGAAGNIREAIGYAESALDHPFSPRESASLDTLLALRLALVDVWPVGAANLLAVLDQMEEALNQ
jgi:hypothetical protein